MPRRKSQRARTSSESTDLEDFSRGISRFNCSSTKTVHSPINLPLVYARKVQLKSQIDNDSGSDSSVIQQIKRHRRLPVILSEDSSSSENDRNLNSTTFRLDSCIAKSSGMSKHQMDELKTNKLDRICRSTLNKVEITSDSSSSDSKSASDSTDFVPVVSSLTRNRRRIISSSEESDSDVSYRRSMSRVVTDPQDRISRRANTTFPKGNLHESNIVSTSSLNIRMSSSVHSNGPHRWRSKMNHSRHQYQLRTTANNRNVHNRSRKNYTNRRRSSRTIVDVNLPSDSDSSDSIDSFYVSRQIRFRNVPVIQDSDGESVHDISSRIVESNDNGIDNTDVSALNKTSKACSFDTEGESEKCPICLACFNIQEVGSPAVCNHSFCVSCLEQWAKNNNTCPVDRIPFNLIVVRSHLQGKVVREIDVETPSFLTIYRDISYNDVPSSEPESEIDLLEEICALCNQSDNSHEMIYCDMCFRIYHMFCVVPRLRYVPASRWYCTICVQSGIVSDSD